MKNAFVCMAAAVLISACAGGPGVPGGPAVPGFPPPAAVMGDGDRLDTHDFAGLPPEAKSYLQTLSRAFQDQDKNFLLSQGESQFEAEVKPHYDDESYLALLYRAGSYGLEAPRVEMGRPRLSPEEISAIEYSGWEERGPVLEIRGKLIARTGTVPCVIMLIWRLKEPKIQGLYP
ncbi:MAG: hypothetical protein LBE14_04315 [Treponema sp.]|nr:hypothetical protein [Treponema sp.]